MFITHDKFKLVFLAEAEVVRGRRVAYFPYGEGRAAEVVLPPEIIKLMKGVYQRCQQQQQRRTDRTCDDRTNLVLGRRRPPKLPFLANSTLKVEIPIANQQAALKAVGILLAAS